MAPPNSSGAIDSRLSKSDPVQRNLIERIVGTEPTFPNSVPSNRVCGVSLFAVLLNLGEIVEPFPRSEAGYPRILKEVGETSSKLAKALKVFLFAR